MFPVLFRYFVLLKIKFQIKVAKIYPKYNLGEDDLRESNCKFNSL